MNLLRRRLLGQVLGGLIRAVGEADPGPKTRGHDWGARAVASRSKAGGDPPERTQGRVFALRLADRMAELPPSEYGQGAYGAHPCGTPRCIAGHAWCLRTGDTRVPMGAHGPQQMRIVEAGQDAMALTNAEAQSMFGLGPWGERHPPTLDEAVRILSGYAWNGRVRWVRLDRPVALVVS